MIFTIDFRKISGHEDAANFLGVRSELLEELLNASGNPDIPPLLYERHRIPKKRSPTEHRLVWSTSVREVRDTHTTFARRFRDFAERHVIGYPTPAAYGYLRGRGIKHNAARHCGQPWLFRCDIRDFFGSITKSALKSDFARWGLTEAAAEILSTLSTIEGRLALGLNASPLLANLHCIDLDVNLQRLAQESGCIYTRYADDITISGTELPSRQKVLSILANAEFQASPQKMRTTRIGQAHFVTGLSVSESNGPRLPRPFKERLRQELHYASKFGLRNHLAKLEEGYQAGINRLDGTVRFAAYIEEKLGPEIRAQWARILDCEGASTSYSPLKTRQRGCVYLMFDECSFSIFGRSVHGLACLSTEKPEYLRALAELTIQKYQSDPYSSGAMERMRENTIHMTSAHEAFRQPYFAQLAALPFRCYVAYKTASGPLNGSVYRELMTSLIRRRLMDSDGAKVIVQVERSSVATKQLVDGVVMASYSSLVEKNDRRPVEEPQVAVLEKGADLGLLAVDAMAWALQRAVAKVEIDEIDFKRFERLRDRYRYILDMDTGMEFSRRMPVPVGDQKT